MGKVYHRRKRPSTLNKNLQMSRPKVWRTLKNAPKRGKPPINQNPQFSEGFLKDKGTAVGEAACSLIADSITDKCLSNVTEDRFFHKIIHLYYNLIWLAIQG